MQAAGRKAREKVVRPSVRREGHATLYDAWYRPTATVWLLMSERLYGVT